MMIAAASLVAGAFIASPELRAYAANTVGSADIIDGQVKTADLANSAVTAAKINQNFISSKFLFDGQGGWNPDGTKKAFTISDSRVNALSGIVVNLTFAPSTICVAQTPGSGAFSIGCSTPPPNGVTLHYTVIN